jgi:hypothetical protein
MKKGYAKSGTPEKALPPRATWTIGGTAYQVGDAVHMRNPQAKGSPFVAIIRKFHQPQDSLLVNVQWFYRPCDMTARVLSNLPGKDAVENELFETLHVDDNDAATLDGKCFVSRVTSVSDWTVRAAQHILHL